MVKKGKVVANASPLIYLSKAEGLHLLRQLFDVVYTTPEVRAEVVDRGKSLGKADASVVEKAISEEWLKVKGAPLIALPITLQRGEETAISLAKQVHADFLIIDEVRGRRAAELVGVPALGTVGVLLFALRRKYLDLDGFLAMLDRLVHMGFRLRPETYLYAVSRARAITKHL